ncbi:TPA: AAA family ATPase [Pseudomonas aeruginosa]|uniref:AAA family ATPase n=1 Tax=Pseudomonas aeruginosa TaxID=287 RepID=UPI0022CDC07A|nr:AAA family ATPase [Pseudomonas aeruginosa]MBX6583440.1 AAA family ATPase [Pseudomonas aeruginosa]MBX6631799.1 AAA family ATPase [Pseudomonas aeruginosa]MCZ9831451.1 AAA family ATPase [Pseudomonas aeruginosa]HBO2152775.1 AAA family ATPase [Pseudomonas aeruginosa]HCI2696234.1 AAA family ATPase [Pseudomonas aeruginosa]
MIVLLGGEKGGSGKSCLAQNLAVWLQRAGRDVLVLDADPQGTTADWAKERVQVGVLPPLPVVQDHGNIRQTLLDLQKRYEDIIVDAGGADSEALRSAMTVATHMLIPFRPKRRDLKTLPKVEALVRLAKASNSQLIVRAVITQAPALPSQGQRILDSKEACTSFGIQALQAFTTARNVYDDADEDGSSVLETGTDSKAIEEIDLIAKELFAEVV